MNADFGPGAIFGSPGLVGRLYDYVARLSRGHVWITGPDFETPVLLPHEMLDANDIS